MSEYLPQVIIAAIGLVLVAGFFLLFFRNKPRLDNRHYRFYVKKIKETQSLDPAHAILNAHKFFSAALGTIYPERKNTAAEKIHLVVDRLPNEKAVWRYHRLRNSLAHDVHTKVSDKDAENARRVFVRALGALR